MKKKISVGVAIVAAVLCSLATFMASYLVLENRFEKKYTQGQLESSNEGETESKEPESEDENYYYSSKYSDFINKLATKLATIDSIYRTSYIGELDDETLIDSVLAGYVAGTGDQYGAYYNAEAFLDFMSEIEGETAGIGVNVIYNSEYKLIEVLNVIPDSPADKAGIMPGDLIVTVGEERESAAELGYYPTVNKLRGEVGTVAVFSVLRGVDYSEEVQFHITRETVISQSVMYHVYGPDNTVGYIRITGFDAQTPQQFVDAVEDLTKNFGCDKLAIDLRYNPGGELSSIVTTLDYILPEGPVIRIFDADGNEVKTYYSESTELNIPMAVLVNGSTASAAELFTSAVRDYNKATIVGTTTYGKGCMQSTIPLSDGSAVTVTYRMYNPPFSDNYHGVGIVPDVVVELDEALADKNIYKITDEEDNQLAAAVATFYKFYN